MDTESISLFLDIWKSGSFRWAAERHGMTQSAASKKMAQLEKELGITLFARALGARKVYHTEAGRKFSRLAERMAPLYQEALHLRDGGYNTSCLTIACLYGAQDGMMPQVVRRLSESLFNFSIRVENHPAEDVLGLVEQGDADLCVTTMPSRAVGVESRLLFSEEYRVVLRKEQKLFQVGATVHPRQLEERHEILRRPEPSLLGWHAQWWRPLRCKIAVDTATAAAPYFSDGEDWMIAPAYAALGLLEKGFVSFPLQENPPNYEMYLSYRPKNPIIQRENVAEMMVQYATEV